LGGDAQKLKNHINNILVPPTNSYG
jgi:hypothetical protein